MPIRLKQKAIDTDLLKQSIRECKAFVVSSPEKEKAEYFFGGGFYDEDSSCIVLYVDYVRPSHFKTMDARDIVHAVYNREYCDILFKSGTWISGIMLKKIHNIQYDYIHRYFTDERVLIEQGDVRIIDLLSVQPTFAEQRALCSVHPLPAELLNYPNPLTFAYIDDDSEARIGYWDMIKTKIVGDTERMEIPLLDKSG